MIIHICFRVVQLTPMVAMMDHTYRLLSVIKTITMTMVYHSMHMMVYYVPCI